MKRAIGWAIAATAAGGVILSVACGGGTPPPQSASIAPGGTKDQSNWPKDDKSMCEWKNRPDLEVVETAGPGAFRPNVRRVFKWVGDKDLRKRVLVCREIDENLDGIKDDVRWYITEGPKTGEPKKEEQDTDYDGRIDRWIEFVDGRISSEAVDTRHAGTPDTCKFYLNGALSRVRRNTHCKYPAIDCRVVKPTTSDTWEIYNKGHLVRIGTDNQCDGHVDRWDRDTERLAQIDAENKEAEKRKAEADAATPTTVGADGSVAPTTSSSAAGGDAGRR